MSLLPAGLSRTALICLLLTALLLLPLAALLAIALFGFEFPVLLHLARTVLLETVWVSTLLAAGSLAGALLIGVSAAWCIERYEFRGRLLLSWLLVLPLAMPTYVIAYAYTDLLQYSGPLQRALRSGWGWDGRLPEIRSLGGAIVLFALVLYPYVYLLARTALGQVSRSLIESAQLLGESGAGMVRRVVLPIIAPAVVAGGMLVLMETLADVGASHYFGLPTFSANIYKTWFALGERGAALLLAVVLLLAIGLIYGLERWARGRARHSSGQSHRPWPRRALRPAAASGLLTLLMLPVLLGFLIPLGNLLWLLLREPELTTDLSRFWDWFGHSLTLGLLGASATVLLATTFAYALRFSEGTAAGWLRLGTASLSFGYAVPGAVIALAILWPVASADNWLADRMDWSQTLLSGTIFGLLYAYLLRFFAVAWGGIDAAVGRLSPNLDAAARSLGAPRWQVFARIHLPLLWRSLAVAWMLVLIDVMKELPATLMLRPFNYDTLAVIAQQLAQDERLAEAALPSIAIVLAGLLPVVGLSRLLLGGSGKR